MATIATIVPKATLCNIITYILKQNAKLQEKLNIRSCQNCKHNKSCPGDGSCVQIMKCAIAGMMEAGYIYMLRGWNQSKGARLEHFLARVLKYNIIYEEQAE